MRQTTTICSDYVNIYTKENPRLKKILFLEGDALIPQEVSRDSYSEMAAVALSLMNPVPPVIEGGTEFFLDSIGYHKNLLKKKWRLLDSVSYSDISPYQSNLVAHPTRPENIQFVVGKPLTVLHYSSLPSSRRHHITKQIQASALDGFHVVGMATKEQFHGNVARKDVHGLSFLGIALFQNELEPDAQEVNKQLQEMGIKMRILSSDLLHTCKAIGRKVGLHSLHDSCATGHEIQSLHDNELRHILPTTTIVSDLSPLDITRIIRLLEESGERVVFIDKRMTGSDLMKTIAYGHNAR